MSTNVPARRHLAEVLSDGSPRNAGVANENAALRRENLTLRANLRTSAAMLAASEAKSAAAEERIATNSLRAKADLETRLFAERQSHLLALDRLREEVEVQRHRANELQRRLDEEISTRSAAEKAGGESDSAARALRKELLDAHIQIQAFAKGAPPHLLREVSRACALDSEAAPAEPWLLWPFPAETASALAASSSATNHLLGAGADPALLATTESPALLSMAGLVTPAAPGRASSSEEDHKHLVGHPPEDATAKRPNPNMPHPVLGLSTHWDLWFKDRGYL